MQPVKTLGVILAGGQSKRMGTEKAFMPLGGQPLIAHVIHRFRPQVGGLVINGNGDAGRYAKFALPVIADDPAFAQAGPLAGILAGLEYAHRHGHDAIATVPCDTPFLPADFVAQLRLATPNGSVGCCVGQRGHEPLFALWPISVAPVLRQFVQYGGRKVLEAVVELPHHFVPIVQSAKELDPFLNLNRPEDTETAHNLLTKD